MTSVSMTGVSTQELLDDMTDFELLAWYDEAMKNLEIVAAKERDSEWHSTCFGALFVIRAEMNKRGFDDRKLY
jgi:hypothetical protein